MASIIRKAERRDLEAVGRLLQQVLKVHHDARPDLFNASGRKYSDEELLSIFGNPDTPVFVYDEDGRVLGYVFCELRHQSSGSLRPLDTLYIDDICVDESSRGRHIGRALFEFAKSFAAGKGCYNITLHVWECNPGAKAFYESMGMTPQYTSMEFVCRRLSPSLVSYIESEVIPRYASFDKAHREDHAEAVISRALAMGKAYDIDEDMLYAAAACHDLGLAVDRKTHHLESGRIIRADVRLREWFTPEQIETIAQAAEDHRASATTPPRSIYGSLVAEADRMIVPETIIRRTVQFGLSHCPELDKEGHWQRTLEHLHEKYAEGGYLHLLIPGSPNEEPLSRLRAIIKDEARLREIFETVFSEESE